MAMSRSVPIRPLLAIPAALAALALAAPAADAELKGKWGAENKKIKLRLTLRDSRNEGSLRIKGASDDDTAGVLYWMDCRKPGGKPKNVFAVQPITGSNPISLSAVSDVTGTRCTLKRDNQPWTSFTLRRR
jgi:hypothetical protein